MSDLVGNPEDRFSRVEAQFIMFIKEWNDRIDVRLIDLFLHFIFYDSKPLNHTSLLVYVVRFTRFNLLHTLS